MFELASNPILDLVQQIVSGIAFGGVYASLALALVLIYRAMDVANFAQGEMAMFSTFIAYTLITGFHLSFFIVFPLTVAIAFAGGLVIERIMIRPFEGKPTLTLVIVTLALFDLTNGLAGLIWGYILKDFPSPFSAAPIVFGGIYIGQ
jgi:branched-chain amino acid transport system permease protein